jgi:hypothetical protein
MIDASTIVPAPTMRLRRLAVPDIGLRLSLFVTPIDRGRYWIVANRPFSDNAPQRVRQQAGDRA